MNTWGELFERASAVEADVAGIREHLATRRDRKGKRNGRQDRSDGVRRNDGGD